MGTKEPTPPTVEQLLEWLHNNIDQALTYTHKDHDAHRYLNYAKEHLETLADTIKPIEQRARLKTKLIQKIHGLQNDVKVSLSELYNTKQAQNQVLEHIYVTKVKLEKIEKDLHEIDCRLWIDDDEETEATEENET